MDDTYTHIGTSHIIRSLIYVLIRFSYEKLSETKRWPVVSDVHAKLHNNEKKKSLDTQNRKTSLQRNYYFFLFLNKSTKLHLQLQFENNEKNHN